MINLNLGTYGLLTKAKYIIYIYIPYNIIAVILIFSTASDKDIQVSDGIWAKLSKLDQVIRRRDLFATSFVLLAPSSGKGGGSSIHKIVIINNLDVHQQMNGKKAVVHIYNGVLLSHQKEYIWISSNEVDETGAYYTEWSKPERNTPIQYTNAYIWNLERW